jgi:Glycosidases
MEGRITSLLEGLYGLSEAARVAPRVEALVGKWKALGLPRRKWVDEGDAILITYGDSIREPGRPPLESLREVVRRRLGGAIGSIHLLPMYPYSSDDGFSVIDPRSINPELGYWDDIEALSEDCDLMFDAVVNHLSASSETFRRFLDGDPQFKDFFIERGDIADCSAVIRPRALPLFTSFEGGSGDKLVWTTFSDDQVDLNYRNPEVLLFVLDLLCFYAAKGARYIRLDAIGFAWKESGGSCLNLPGAHAIVKLIRAVLDEVAPGTILVTETNVPFAENLAYLGDGSDEANLVYQFTLPPLVLHTFYGQDSSELLDWMDSLGESTPSSSTSYLNFLSSHDGIGLRPVEGILSPEAIDALVESCLERGGLIGYRHSSDGLEVPYELNINYMDALSPPGASDEERAARSVAAHGILLAAMGVPAIYVHALFGSRNWIDGARESGINRRINRERLDAARLEAELDEDRGLRGAVFRPLVRLLEARRGCAAFHPNAPQRPLRLDRRVVSFERESADGSSRVLVAVNVTGERVELGPRILGRDLVSGREVGPSICLAPFEVLYLARR